MAVRAALGAGRGRIARLLLLESGVLGAAGTGMGLVGAVWLTPLAVPMFAVFGEQITLDLHANWRMMTFAGAAGLVSALAAGLAPILRSARATTRLPLHDGGRLATAGVATTRWGRRLVIAQFAVTLGLVVTAGLLVRTFWNLQSIPTGLDVDHVALVGVDTQAAQLDPPAMRAYVARVTERLTSLTGVRAAGFGRVIPLGFGGSRMTIRIPGYEPAPDEDMELNYNVVSPGYFDALGIGIVDGRALDATDTDRGRLAVVVNETMARRYWPGGRAVGRQMRVGGDSPPLQVVGVARDVKYRTIRERPRPSFYLSLLQAASPRGGTFHIRTAGDPADMLVVVRHAVGEADPAVPVTRTLTLRDQLLLNINRERVTMVLGLGLGLTALLLAAVGLFGAMANLVGSRTRELGVRLALGAVPGQLARLVLKTGLVMALWGSLFGLLLASALGGIVGTLLYGVGAIDPLTVLASVAALVAVAGVAAWLPARRAARVDPVVALRVE
jgi:putative ABC transport system permease protein